MVEESVSLDSSKLGKVPPFSWHAMSLKWKIGSAFSGIILLLGILVVSIVYTLTSSALHKQVNFRASAIATNLSDAAAGHVSRRNTLELDALVAKYGRLEGVAYAFVQDAKGEVIASSAQPFPAELKDSAADQPRSAGSGEVTLRGRPVYETRVPVLDGQLGSVRVGLWADAVQQDVRSTLFPIIGLIAVCLIVGILVSMLIANTTIKPIIELAAVADDISRGRLDTPVSVRSGDEVGELARSLERMRASLKAAMVRLSKS
ncbi:MAG TPA: HAMP domain-containing protein [Candidatus Binatia bacterium]|jgi:nitrogen fixation/metabolism regulation signal transduction histidine kinase